MPRIRAWFLSSIRLKSEASASAVPEIERYRALCLMALNRGSEADKVIDGFADTLHRQWLADSCLDQLENGWLGVEDAAHFDAHVDDPLADMALTDEGFRELARGIIG